MKAYLLARVSTDDQKDALPAQTIRLVDYAQRQCFMYELYELRESAYSGDRQKFRAVVDSIVLEKETVAVVFDKIDRLTRDPTSDEYIRLVRMCEKGLIELHFPADNIAITRDSPATDKMRLGFGVALAQYYSASISDNVKRRQAQMLRDGLWTGAAPLGYRYTTQDGKKWIVPDPAKASIVRYMFTTYATDTISLLGIRKDLIDRFGFRFSRAAIEGLLKNPFYYGVMRVKGKLYPHNYEPLIDKELFDTVQDMLSGRAKNRQIWSGLPFPYRGLITCHECGCRVTFETKKQKYTYGHCTQSKYKHDAKYVSQAKITAQVMEIIKKIHIPNDVLYQLRGFILKTKTDKTSKIEDRRALLQAEVARYNTRLIKMYDDRLDGLISDEHYRQKHQEFTTKKAQLEEDLQNIELLDNKRLDDFSYLLELANSVPKLFETADYREKRNILKKILSNLQLDGDLLRWKYKKPFDLMASCNENVIWRARPDSNRRSPP